MWWTSCPWSSTCSLETFLNMSRRHFMRYVYVYMYTCMYTCIHVYVYVWSSTCSSATFLNMSRRHCTCIHVCLHAYMYMCMCHPTHAIREHFKYECETFHALHLCVYMHTCMYCMYDTGHALAKHFQIWVGYLVCMYMYMCIRIIFVYMYT
jgi:hypothetical protein